MFFEQNLYNDEIARDFDDQQANYIFALGYAMIQNELGL